jgi:hypothetical protein
MTSESRRGLRRIGCGWRGPPRTPTVRAWACASTSVPRRPGARPGARREGHGRRSEILALWRFSGVRPVNSSRSVEHIVALANAKCAKMACAQLPAGVCYSRLTCGLVPLHFRGGPLPHRRPQPLPLLRDPRCRPMHRARPGKGPHQQHGQEVQAPRHLPLQPLGRSTSSW